MKTILRILIIEDSEEDALLMLHQIKKAGYDIEYERIEDAETLKMALKEKTWDIIFSDYNMPRFNGLEALAILKKSSYDIPFIIISGTIGEETAVKAMKAGAHDYIMKNNMHRLVPAFERELRESKNRAVRKLLEQKHIKEEALKLSEEKYRYIFDNISDGIFLLEVTEDGRFRNLEMNNSFLELTGTDRNLIQGKFIEETVPEESANIVIAKYRHCVEMECPFEEETEINLPIGKRIFLSSLIPVRNETGRIHRIVGIIHDITKRKQAEEALRVSEEKMKKLAEAAFDPIIMMDNDGKISYWNNAAEKILGYTSHEAIGKEMHSLLAPKKYLQSYRKGFEHFRTTGQGDAINRTLELEALRKDGTEFPIELSVSAFQLNSKWNAVGILREITERKRMEEKLRVSEEQHRLLFETALEGIAVLQENKFRYFNPMIMEFSGYSSDELLCMDFLDIVFPEDRDKVLTNYLKRMSGENAEQRYQFRIVKKDKTLRWVEVSAVKFSWKEQPASFAFFNDITDQKLAEMELQKLNEELQISRNLIEENLFQKNLMVEELTETKEKLEKLNIEKDKFFSIIAHDLRSPFNTLLGLTEIMVEDLPSLTMDEIQEFSVNMRNSATKLFRLLENLLQWARMQQGLIPFNPELIQLLPIVNECIGIMQEPVKNKEIEITYDIPDNLKVFADGNILQTVIRNLVSNAVKFTPKGGKISLLAKAKNDAGVEISIKDTGIGMSRTMVDNLFRLDVKTNRVGTEGEPSTGLGLLICKEFIEKHGGNIWVESVEGKGTTFYFTVP